MTTEKWQTLKDAFDGIEWLLLACPTSMRDICNHGARHGSGDMQTIGFVRALVSAERIEVVLRPFAPGHTSTYRLTDWNRAALLAEQGETA